MVMRADEHIRSLVLLALQRNDEAESATVFTHDAFDGAALAEMRYGCVGQEGVDELCSGHCFVSFVCFIVSHALIIYIVSAIVNTIL